MEDKSILVATYEGQHNHDARCSSAQYFSSSPDHDHQKVDKEGPTANFPRNDHHHGHQTCRSTASTSPSSPPNPTLYLSLSTGSIDNQEMIINREVEDRRSNNSINDLNKPNKEIEEYVASLTKDRSFTVALAKAVARSIGNADRRTGSP